MTDLELLTEYDKHADKVGTMVRAMYAEECSLGEIAARLRKLGRKPQRGIVAEFGTDDPDCIPEILLEDYARRHRIPVRETEKRQEAQPQTGVVDEYCDGCHYRSGNFGAVSCEYIIIEKKRRGCPAGTGCKRRKLRRGGSRGNEAEQDQGTVQGCTPGNFI